MAVFCAVLLASCEIIGFTTAVLGNDYTQIEIDRVTLKPIIVYTISLIPG